MPELPEVESLRQRLSADLPGRVVRDVHIHWLRTIDRPAAPEFTRILRNRCAIAVARRGKFLVIQFRSRRKQSPSVYLLCHLRMSGRLLFSGSSIPDSLHGRVGFQFADGAYLLFSDPRKFGRMYLVQDIDEVVGALGPEPLSPDFSVPTFYAALKRRKGALKPLLLNQRFLAGLGNIYVDEALWRARLHPLRSACSLSKKEARALHRAIQTTLRRAIELEGTDAGDNVVVGYYQPSVYGRSGRPCRRCKCPLERTVIGQRGTSFCPRCQPTAIQNDWALND